MKLLIDIILYFNMKICYVLLTKIIPIQEFEEVKIQKVAKIDLDYIYLQIAMRKLILFLPI